MLARWVLQVFRSQKAQIARDDAARVRRCNDIVNETAVGNRERVRKLLDVPKTDSE